MAIYDVLKIGPLPLVGLGLAALAVPLFVPALRPQFAGVLKAGAKLFLEAELGADDALTGRLVDAAVGALMQVTAHGSDERRKSGAERVMHRFASAARAAARRRGFNDDDIGGRYHKHFARLDHALARVRTRASGSQATALDHASKSLAVHRARGVHHVEARSESLRTLQLHVS
jgi:hypothetical protein